MADGLSMKFLHVESDPKNIHLMRGLLCEHLGCEVLHASSAAEAVRFLETIHDISCILTDLNLPGSSGFLFLQKLFANPGWRKIPIIVCTAEVKKSIVLDVAKIGVRHYICKPVTFEKLRRRLTEALEMNHLDVPPRVELLLELGLSSDELDEIQSQARKDLERIVARKFADRCWEERERILQRLWPWTNSNERTERTDHFNSRSA